VIPENKGLLDFWRSEAFRLGVEYGKNKAAETVYAMLRTQDARLIEAAIMRIEPPKSDDATSSAPAQTC
jgi:hypothetical protein